MKEVTQAVEKHLGVKVASIVDKGSWIRHIYDVQLQNGESVIVKLVNSAELAETHRYVVKCNQLIKYGLPAPKVLAVDNSCDIIPAPFTIEEKLTGQSLSDVLPQATKEDTLAIYQALGSVYRKMHSVHNERAGLWGDTPKQLLYPIHPNDYMFKVEIVEDSGKKVCEQGLISQTTYDRMVAVWQKNLGYLKMHQPCMIHSSAFWWTIAVSQVEGAWQVTRLTSLNDVLWWDAAYDLALIKYPPFTHTTNMQWQSFLKSYGKVPEKKRLLLYTIMQRVCAANGVYMEPAIVHDDNWVKQALAELPAIIDEVEACS